jgi:hypothetical protein
METYRKNNPKKTGVNRGRSLKQIHTLEYVPVKKKKKKKKK